LWFGVTVFGMLSYPYRVHSWANCIFHAEGTPLTAWQRFVGHNVNQHISLDALYHGRNPIEGDSARPRHKIPGRLTPAAGDPAAGTGKLE
jgi:hypothetical protein